MPVPTLTKQVPKHYRNINSGKTSDMASKKTSNCSSKKGKAREEEDKVIMDLEGEDELFSEKRSQRSEETESESDLDVSEIDGDGEEDSPEDEELE